LSNQLLFDTLNLRYTSAVSSKRQESLAFPLCRFSFADGRRCAQPAHPQSNGLCFTHAHAPLRRLRPSDLYREVTSSSGAIVPPEKIRRVLAKIPLALAQGLFTPKQAAALHYLCNVLIHSSRLARGESLHANPDPDRAFFSNFHDDDDHENADLPAYPPLD